LVAARSGRTLAGVTTRLRLLTSCPDRRGIVAAVGGFVADAGGNITSSHQHTTDPDGGRFFTRVEFSLPEGLRERTFAAGFARVVADPFGMTWSLSAADRPKRVALLASRYDHCLLDQLWRWRSGELPADIRVVISNHADLQELVAGFGVSYVHVPVTSEAKPEAEERLLRELEGRVDLVVLARYMQILSEDFLDRVGVPVINIHHSFLPAFAGADPYRRAFDRGVKLIGATAHYVTAELDAGPIIEQDVVRVTHADTVADLTGFGRDVERLVLAKAVRLHLEDRVMIDGDRTVVFA
jgi:formyltetrahydrofolate deformylase